MLSPPTLEMIPSLHAIVLVTGGIILPRSGPNTLSAADWQRHNGPLLPTWRSAQTSDGDGNRGVVASPPKAWGDKCLHLDLCCTESYLRLLLVEVELLNPWPAFACSWNTCPTFRSEIIAVQTHPSFDLFVKYFLVLVFGQICEQNGGFKLKLKESKQWKMESVRSIKVKFKCELNL